MAEIRIGELKSQVDVTDSDALLSPRILTRIVAMVEAELERKAREAEALSTAGVQDSAELTE